MSWRPEVFVDRKWSANAVRMATKEEAESSAFNLLMRWTLCEDSRVVESADRVNYRWDAEKGNVPLPAPAEASGRAA